MRQPGLNLLRQPVVEETPLPRIYTSGVPTATYPPATKIYPLQIGLTDTRVVGILADQSEDQQNLELVLADPPATIASSSTYSGT